jgi:hypothetical protein
MCALKNPLSTVRVGVTMEGVQLSDVVGIDILGNLFTNFLSTVVAMFSGPACVGKSRDTTAGLRASLEASRQVTIEIAWSDIDPQNAYIRNAWHIAVARIE